MVDEDRPVLADLHLHIVPKYAVHWEDLGLHLGLNRDQVAIISKNNAYNPDRTRDCCKEMLAKWLNIDTSATWGKLKDAINTIKVEDAPVSNSPASKLS